MEITEHQANLLRALADGKTLQACRKEPDDDAPFDGDKRFDIEGLEDSLRFITTKDYYVRIKPNVIVVNGIEVPAPESVALRRGDPYYVPNHLMGDYHSKFVWDEDGDDRRFLVLGIVYRCREHAAARGKAMLARKPG